MQKKNPLKGFRDFLPEEAAARDYLRKNIQEVFELYGFEPLETPTLEKAEVLLGKYGEEADKLLYLFEDRGGRKVGLRYDLTVPTSRVLALYGGNKIPLPFKRYQMQNIFRAEKPQRGRYREAIQCDVDIFGVKSLLADAEVLATICAALDKVGIEGYVVRLNSRKILFNALQTLKIEGDEQKAKVLRIVDKLDKKGREGVVKELEEEGFSQKILDFFESLEPDREINEIINLAVDLGVSKKALKFDPFLVRGLDYYTGMIFEIVKKGESIGSIAGGGRYDSLVKLLGGPDIPAVGGTLGLERIYDLLKDRIIKKIQQKKRVFVTVFSKEFLKESIEIVKQLRKIGIISDIYLKEKFDLKKQVKYADTKGYPYVVFYGPEEKLQGKIKLRNMKSGEEQLIEIERLGEFLK